MTLASILINQEYYWIFLILLGLMAFLYASVGHGGASGYLAVLAIFGANPSLMKSSALVLNLAVSILSFYQYYRSGHFKFKLFLPFAIGSIPMAYVGAITPISDDIYKKILGFALISAILRILISFKSDESKIKNPQRWQSLLTGGIIGLLSGMIGIGGGIILSPIMLLFNWGRVKEVAAVSALFIFVNSFSGLIGLLSKGYKPEAEIYNWILIAIICGFAGGYLGSKKFNNNTLKVILALVLVVASVKLILT